MMGRKLFYLALATALLCWGQAHARKWTDSTGKYSVEAEFVELVGQTVTLRRSDGEVIRVPLERLSRSDRQYVQHRGRPVGSDADQSKRHQRRWLGYMVHQRPEGVREFASYTNVVLDRGWRNYGDALIEEARRRKLKVVLEFHSHEKRDTMRQQVIPLAARNRDVVMAICCTGPYLVHWSPSDLSTFGQEI